LPVERSTFNKGEVGGRWGCEIDSLVASTSGTGTVDAITRQVAEAEVARRKAVVEGEAARKAGAEATAAKREVERLFREKKAELEEYKKRKKDIIDGKLSGGATRAAHADV